MSQIYPCLWFDTQALEAAEFYVSLFPNSKLGAVSYYGPNMHLPEGTVLTVNFELDGQQFMALNGGPAFHFTEAISLVVSCETQAEIDALYDKLSVVPEAEICGWLKDKYGLSWQILHRQFEEMVQSGNKAKFNAAMQAVMQMKRLDLAKIQAAYDAG